MYFCTNGQLPQSLQCLFTLNADVHQHNTRHHIYPHVFSRTSTWYPNRLYMQPRRLGGGGGHSNIKYQCISFLSFMIFYGSGQPFVLLVYCGII